MKKQLTQDLESAKKQLSYVTEALASNLELWERKEYEAVKSDLIKNINSLEYRLATCF